MGSAIEDAWDSVTDSVSSWWDDITDVDQWKKDPFGNLISLSGPVTHAAWGGVKKGWNKAKDSITDALTGGGSSYDLSASESQSACGGGACAKAADETKIPAVAQSISGDAAQAVEAQGTARKRARGIMQTYTRYDSGGNGGKSKLGE